MCRGYNILHVCAVYTRSTIRLHSRAHTGLLSAAREVQALACAGGGSSQDLVLLIQSTAQALAEAVARTEITCSSNGGDDNHACALATSDVEVIARAQVRHPCSAQPLPH